MWNKEESLQYSIFLNVNNGTYKLLSYLIDQIGYKYIKIKICIYLLISSPATLLSSMFFKVSVARSWKTPNKEILETQNQITKNRTIIRGYILKVLVSRPYMKRRGCFVHEYVASVQRIMMYIGSFLGLRVKLSRS